MSTPELKATRTSQSEAVSRFIAYSSPYVFWLFVGGICTAIWLLQ